MNNKLLNSKNELYLEIALIINKQLFDNKVISPTLYKNIETNLLNIIEKEEK